jgi:hypothetical protein
MLFEHSVDEADAVSEIPKFNEVSCTDASLAPPKKARRSFTSQQI